MIGCWPGIPETLLQSSASHKSDLETRGSELPGPFWLQSEFKANLDNRVEIRPGLYSGCKSEADHPYV